MKNYELSLILEPELAQETLNKLIQDIAAFIQEKGGLLEKQELKGRQRNGILAVLGFSAKQEEIENLTKRLKGEKGLRRFIIVLAPHHAEKTPSLTQRAPLSKTQEKAVPEEVKMSVEEIDKKLAEIFKES